MIILILEKHWNFANKTHGLITKLKAARGFTALNCRDYSHNIDYEHPERQLTILQEIIKKYNNPPIIVPHVTHGCEDHVMITSYSPFVIKFFNLALKQDPNLHFEAYEVVESKLDPHSGILKPAIQNNLIDERILSHPFDKLAEKVNRL